MIQESEKEKKARYMRDWRSRNPDRAKAIKAKYVEKYREKHLETSRNSALKNRYGITLDDYNNMLFDQKGLCAICGTKSGEGRQRLVVDHCHKTGAVRKLLCQPCNTIVGMCFEDKNILLSAAKYIGGEL